MPSMELLTRSSLSSESWWDVLTPAEQRTMLIETQHLSEALCAFSMSRMAIGEHLLRIRDILQPKRKFKPFLRSHCNSFTVATAYRWIDVYVATKDSVPELVLQTAIARGYDIVDLEMVKRMPPPRTQDKAKIVAYLNRLKEARTAERVASTEQPTMNPDDLCERAFRFIEIVYEKLPDNPRTRSHWLEKLNGMITAKLAGEERPALPAPKKVTVMKKKKSAA